MRATSIIFRRELGAYLHSWVGWVVAAILLAIDGIFFQSYALGRTMMSSEVLEAFFYYTSGCTMAAGVALSIRLLAEERQTGTIVLLNTAPVRDFEIVLGKFFSAFAFLAIITLLTFYMPMLILVNGKISFAHVAVGYLGLLLLGAAALSMGIFASALTRHMLVAAAVGAALVVGFIVLWNLSVRVDAPLRGVLGTLAIWAKHFPPFQRGILELRHVVYYLAITYFFLLLATKTLEAKRWQ